MAKRIKKSKCKHCHVFFLPDPRNAWHQEYCTQPECRKASKNASRKKWLEKEENRDYFRGPANVQRVQEWRRTHPGYRRSAPPQDPEPLQDLLSEKTEEKPFVAAPRSSSSSLPLQDLLTAQHFVLIGLISQLADSVLQDHIAAYARRLQQLGIDIVHGSTLNKGENDDPKTSSHPRAHSEGPQPVQLGGSAPGA